LGRVLHEKYSIVIVKKKRASKNNKKRKNEDESEKEKEKIGVWSLSGYSFASILMGSLWYSRKITRFHR
jgi:hypothetical protein